jgi:hypothetical protein
VVVDLVVQAQELVTQLGHGWHCSARGYWFSASRSRW